MKIALFADSHLGYRAGRAEVNGVNLREMDGYSALHEIVSQIIAESPDVVVHGGDLFHTPTPSIRSIVKAHDELRRLVNAGIPVFLTSGNHDTSDILSELPATSSVAENGVSVVSGRENTFEAAPGLRLFVVGHRGVESTAHIVDPVPGDVNILVSHAAVEEEGEMLHTEDAPREKLLNDEALDLPWSAVLLGHIHQRHFVKGRDNVLYSGSALRRGFSDKKGKRGWTMVDVSPDGNVEYRHHDITQRPQFDLGTIDATGMTGSEVAEKVLELADVPDMSIVRIEVSNCAPLVGREFRSNNGISELRARMLTFTSSTTKPEADTGKDEEHVSADENVFGDSNTFTKWARSNAILDSLSEERKARVISEGGEYVNAAKDKKLVESV